MKPRQISLLSSLALGLGLPSGGAQTDSASSLELRAADSGGPNLTTIVEDGKLNNLQVHKARLLIDSAIAVEMPDSQLEVRRTSSSFVQTGDAEPEKLRNHSRKIVRPDAKSSAVRIAQDDFLEAHRNYQAELRRVQKELADLNSATDRRRAELMKKIAQTKTKEAAALKQRAQAELGKRSQVESWLLNVNERPNEVPEWVIGIVIDDRSEGGVTVSKVLEGKPAKKAGVRDGDVILECNEIKLRDRGALVKIIQAAQDQPLNLMVRRKTFDEDGKAVSEKTIKLKVAAEKNEVSKLQRAGQNPIHRLLLNEFSPLQKPSVILPQHFNPTPFSGLSQLKANTHHEQLRKDNREVKELLKQLLEEVKKLHSK